MSEQPEFDTIHVCPRCGWTKPKDYTCKKCPKCRAMLVPKTIKKGCEEVIVAKAIYTREYRNQHWKPCRFGLDPRTCGSLHAVWKGEKGKICGRDGARCDAEWTGDTFFMRNKP